MTAGLGIEKKLAEFEAKKDDYSAIMLKSLADRLAEAFAEWLHRQGAPRALGLRLRRGARQYGADPRGIPRHPAGARLSRVSGPRREGAAVRAAARGRRRHVADGKLRDAARPPPYPASTSRTRTRTTLPSGGSARISSRIFRSGPVSHATRRREGSRRISDSAFHDRHPPRYPRPLRCDCLAARVLRSERDGRHLHARVRRARRPRQRHGSREPDGRLGLHVLGQRRRGGQADHAHGRRRPGRSAHQLLRALDCRAAAVARGQVRGSREARRRERRRWWKLPRVRSRSCLWRDAAIPIPTCGRRFSPSMPP